MVWRAEETTRDESPLSPVFPFLSVYFLRCVCCLQAFTLFIMLCFLLPVLLLVSAVVSDTPPLIPRRHFKPRSPSPTECVLTPVRRER